jgi:hypothetical protein
MAFFNAQAGQTITYHIISSGIPCQVSPLPAGTVASQGPSHLTVQYLMPAAGTFQVTMQYLFGPQPPSGANYSCTVSIDQSAQPSIILGPLPDTSTVTISDFFLPVAAAAPVGLTAPTPSASRRREAMAARKAG